MVRSYLENNQLKDLPQDILRNNTKLRYLWVDIFIFRRSKNLACDWL